MLKRNSNFCQVIFYNNSNFGCPGQFMIHQGQISDNFLGSGLCRVRKARRPGVKSQNSLGKKRNGFLFFSERK